MNMRYYYERSIKYLKLFIKEYKKLPNIDEWTSYAKAHNLLNCESIKYISKQHFNKWCKNISTSF